MILQAFSSSSIFFWGEYSRWRQLSLMLIFSMAEASGTDVVTPRAVVVLPRTTDWHNSTVRRPLTSGLRCNCGDEFSIGHYWQCRSVGAVPGSVSAVSGCGRCCAVSPDTGKLAPSVASAHSYTEQLPLCSLPTHTHTQTGSVKDGSDFLSSKLNKEFKTTQKLNHLSDTRSGPYCTYSIQGISVINWLDSTRSIGI